jgi:AcrR family transcriptional regulator
MHPKKQLPSGDTLNTRERILNSAEVLFAEHGFERASLRALTTAARVNLAAVHYHFGSKAALMGSVFERRLAPLNAERLGELDALEIAARGQPLTPAGIIEAFFGPVLRMSMDRGSGSGGHRFIRLLGRAHAESRPAIRDLLESAYVEVVDRFGTALRRALPQVPEKELAWRMHFMLGAMSYVIAGSDAVQLIASYEVRKSEHPESVMKRIAPFLVAGLTAPLPDAGAAKTRRIEPQIRSRSGPGNARSAERRIERKAA